MSSARQGVSHRTGGSPSPGGLRRPPGGGGRESRKSLPAEGGAKVGDIYHLPTGLAISENELIDMLSGARLVCVGETHDNLNDQRVELAVAASSTDVSRGRSPSGWRCSGSRSRRLSTGG